MDFRDELQQVGRLFAKEEYTASAARGVAVIEQVLRHVLQSSLPHLAEEDQANVQLAGEPGQEFGYLRLKPMRVRKDERVSIIQHPGGHFKQISLQNNFVAYADDRIVHYTTSTLPGSSGSPVLNDAFDVIALHHSGGELQDPATGRYELRNAGASSCAILQAVEQHAPDMYRLLEEVLP